MDYGRPMKPFFSDIPNFWAGKSWDIWDILGKLSALFWHCQFHGKTDLVIFPTKNLDFQTYLTSKYPKKYPQNDIGYKKFKK